MRRRPNPRVELVPEPEPEPDPEPQPEQTARTNIAAHPLFSAGVPTPRGGGWVIPGARAIEAFHHSVSNQSFLRSGAAVSAA